MEKPEETERLTETGKAIVFISRVAIGVCLGMFMARGGGVHYSWYFLPHFQIKCLTFCPHFGNILV